MRDELALQLYTVRRSLLADCSGTLRALSSFGCRAVELLAPAFDGGRIAPSRPPREFAKLLADCGLRALNVSLPLSGTGFDQWLQLIDYSCEVSSPAVCCAIATLEDRDGALRVADMLNRIGAACLEHGQRFYYHNHYHEFQMLGPETGLDALVNNTDPELVGFELDVFWALRAGREPVEVMDSLGGRLKLVHLKDLSPDARPVNLFEAIPDGARLDMQSFLGYLGSPADFTELGRGVVDLPAVVKKARSMQSVEHLILEQDQTAIGELESARIGLAYMKALLSAPHA
ncbi:MAG: sugar phosphate isomerase/epimerase [Clostridiales bacterium]|nr:sugar phosphate isomerase/epimerase [Clostridiales bacterium]